MTIMVMGTLTVADLRAALVGLPDDMEVSIRDADRRESLAVSVDVVRGSMIYHPVVGDSHRKMDYSYVRIAGAQIRG